MTSYEKYILQWVKTQERNLPKRYLIEIVTGMNQCWFIIPGLEDKYYFPAGYCSEAAALMCLRETPDEYMLLDEFTNTELWRIVSKGRAMKINGHNDDTSTMAHKDLYLMRKRDTERVMGVYTKVEAWPPVGVLGSQPVFTIEQVHGDCTVDTLTLGVEEATQMARDILARVSKVSEKTG